jgi:hypothetical protein
MMKKLIFITIVSAFLAVPAVADLTPINPSPWPSEPSLLVPKTGFDPILEHLYGAGNFVRIDDRPLPGDQVWMNLDGGATATAKWAAADETFGYIAGSSGGTFVSLFSVPFGTNGYLSEPKPSGIIPSTDPIFRLALNSGFGLWSSKQSDNASPDNDHMVTWLITDGPSAGNYVVGWEVENLGDADYQDLVVEISKAAPVPVPAAVLLGVLGLSIAGLKLRKFA